MSSKANQKLRKGKSIERNWKCDLQNAVPAEIRPRAGLCRGKVLVGSIAREAQWHDWSYKMLSELERLSSMTIGKLAFAQELMLLEVRQRQQDILAKHHNVLEVLLGDLERINRDLAQSRSETIAGDDLGDLDENSDEDEDEDEHEHDERERADNRDGNNDSQLGFIGESRPAVTENELNQQHDTETGIDQAEIKVETNETDINVDSANDGPNVLPRSQSVRSNGITKPSNRAKAAGQTGKLKKDLTDKAKIANLFAEAMRLKQEAAKREAEAYELQAKMLTAEAKQLE